ncbi:MAG: AAA family ATPase [Candidatus Kapabacteria bacterium]|nr:AAA family ATPase [Candidatus Kapabacteria bacterium]
MKFTFENLGYIDRGDITPGNLTIICGNNNVGKTYLNYAIYSFLYNISDTNFIEIDEKYIKDLLSNENIKIDLKTWKNNITEIFSKYSSKFSENIHTFFSTNEEFFHNSKVKLELLEYESDFSEPYKAQFFIGKKDSVKIFKDSNSSEVEFYINNESKNRIPEGIIEDIFSRTISRLLFKNILKRPFIITSERTGISLFYKELDFAKNRMIEAISKETVPHPFQLIESMRARYADSIKHNIDIIRNFDDNLKNKSFLQKDHKEEFVKLSKKISEILNGSFKIVDKQILFETRKERNRDKVDLIPIYLTSSATKSLFLLDIYIRSIAQTNDILMIDEPELNLHPDNQIIIARLLANLVNLGIDIIITTHSDYMIKEFNNLVMLSNEFSEKKSIMSKYKYESNDILEPNKVKAYFVDNHTIKEANIDKYGIKMDLFDKTIMDINAISNEIYYSLEEE